MPFGMCSLLYFLICVIGVCILRIRLCEILFLGYADVPIAQFVRLLVCDRLAANHLANLVGAEDFIASKFIRSIGNRTGGHEFERIPEEHDRLAVVSCLLGSIVRV